MKKIIFSLFLILALSACTQGSKKTMDETSAPDSMAGTEDTDVLQRIHDINNGATPKVKPTGKTEPTPEEAQRALLEELNKQKAADNQAQLENLAQKFNGAIIKTSLGDIKVKFFADDSPITVNNFMNLAQKGFYNKTKFHRIITDFMIQGGDPNSKDDNWADDGTGGPGYKFQDEFNTHKLVRGSLAMANSGPNTNGSQFFIVTKDSTPWLDGRHTNFGQVIDGDDIVKKIEAVKTNERDHPIDDIVINFVTLVNF